MQWNIFIFASATLSVWVYDRSSEQLWVRCVKFTGNYHQDKYPKYTFYIIIVINNTV